VQVKRRHATLQRNQPFRPLPRPSGTPPFHLSLADLLPDDAMRRIEQRGNLVFHAIGDTGGVRSPFAQQIVAQHLQTDADFMYLLGDIVYYYGQAGEYFPQFYEPYAQYPAPIFAIPGNHDGDVIDPTTASLDAFVQAFCASTQQATPLSGEIQRNTMVQPNVYWTLETPFATIVGLYTNVPEGGSLDSDQVGWLHSELQSAPRDKALIIATHHPVYSADRYHGGSEYMEEVLDLAMQKTGRVADLVLSGHVHNYQRYSRSVGETRVPYLVVGAGGYWHLHEMQAGVEPGMPMPDAPGLTLDQYVADRHGFLRVEVSASALRMQYFTVPRPHEHWSDPAAVFDDVTVSIGQQPMHVEVPPPPEPVMEPLAPEPVLIGAEATNGQPVTAEALESAEPRTSFGGP
jgi:predicted phosphodiesterase